MDAGITADIDPLLLARKGKHVSGQLSLKKLPRLAVLSSEPSSGRINVELQFSRDADQQCWMQGSMSGQLEVICQRCLEKMPLTLNSKVNALLVGQTDIKTDKITIAGQESDDSDIGETIIICKAKTTVAKLVEDDLLLAMPMFPKHETGCCNNTENSIKAGHRENQPENPFAVLATLKSDKKTDKNLGKKSGKK